MSSNNKRNIKFKKRNNFCVVSLLCVNVAIYMSYYNLNCSSSCNAKNLYIFNLSFETAFWLFVMFDFVLQLTIYRKVNIAYTIYFFTVLCVLTMSIITLGYFTKKKHINEEKNEKSPQTKIELTLLAFGGAKLLLLFIGVLLICFVDCIPKNK